MLLVCDWCMNNFANTSGEIYETNRNNIGIKSERIGKYIGNKHREYITPQNATGTQKGGGNYNESNYTKEPQENQKNKNRKTRGQPEENRRKNTGGPKKNQKKT